MPDTFLSEKIDNTSGLDYETRSERLRRTQRLSFQRWARAFIFDVLSLLREARVPLGGFFVVMASGTLYWTLIYQETDYTIGHALFETLRMLVFEHNEDYPADLLGQVLFFAVPIFGLAFVFQGVLDFGRLLLDKSSRMEDWQHALAHTHQNHVIICGLGRVSYRVMLQLLEAGYEVVVVEQDWQSEFVQDALALRVPVIQGDARTAPTLRRAGLHRARGLVTGISNDLLNIEVALAARRMRRNLHVVLRIFNDQLDYNLEKSEFGPNTAFSSSALAAPTLAAAAVCRGIKHVVPLPEELIGISELIVSPGSSLDNLIYKIERDFQVQVIGYTSETCSGTTCWRHRVSPTTRLYGGDRVLLLGTLHHLGDVWKHGHERNKIMNTLGIEIPQRITPKYNRVIVCGLGRVGYRVVKALHRMQPRPEIVVICNEDTRPRFEREIDGLGIQLIHGDARIEDVLRDAGIAQAYSVAAVTSDTLSNLRIGLTARQLRGDVHVVLRVFSDVLAEQLEGMFGIHTTFSSSALAAPTLAAAVVVHDTGYAIDLGERLMATAGLVVQPGDEFIGQPISGLREYLGIVIVAVRREQQLYIVPHGLAASDLPTNGRAVGTLLDEALRAGDEVVVLADINKISILRQRGAGSGISDVSITGRATSIAAAPTAAAPGDVSPLPGQARDTDDSQQLLEYLLQNGSTPLELPAAQAQQAQQAQKDEQ
jgi:Trk K+ transport system NAD-binding subunit